MKMRVAWLFFFVMGLPGKLPAALELGFPFGDHAVLQAGKPVPVWGRAGRGAEVIVRLGDREKTARALEDGSWKIEFPGERASSEGVTLVVRSGESEVVCADLVFGEVWVASGQSNMRWRLCDCVGGQEALRSGEDPLLRIMDLEGRLETNARSYPLEFLKGINEGNFYQSKGWQRATGESLGPFSGVGYFFARRLRAELGVPVGVIHLAVGGSPMEAHLPPETLAADPEWRGFMQDWWRNPSYPAWCRGRAALNLREWLKTEKDRAPPHPFAPGFLWEAGIRKILPFPVRGMIWYQGESNATIDGGSGPAVSREVNRKKFESLIRSWRKGWRDESLPVYFVQLPGLNRDWASFREMQREVAREVPGTGMAVTIDVGHATDVHPRVKRPVGERLAALALRGTYGRKQVMVSPVLVAVAYKGSRVIVSFDREVVSKEPDLWFETAGQNGAFRNTQAVLSGHKVIMEDKEGRQVRAVRYAWANDPRAGLEGVQGLPVSPFWEERPDDGDRR